MKNTNSPDIKGKPMFGIVGLIVGFFILWPQPRSSSQTDMKTIAPAQSTIDSLEYLRQLNDRKEDRNLTEAHELIIMTKQLSNKAPRIVSNSIKVLKPTVAIRYNGEIFEPPAEYYKGYVIVDIDNFLEDMNTSVETPVPNEFIDTAFYVPKPKRHWWKFWKR
ncbi:hypothetical protein F0919_17825 [Taibaiella lutea]|uniref:Uncharacterized protein n=1 Tax=Taibaiella lutea TaxID=2608001 RepID=A0A5M6CDV3_9BACT|nr:hypothetical protein [Taibaiella lutea]KAA5532640.1 hypothetical protein F0919_17825 [Taibaiella lutea]